MAKQDLSDRELKARMLEELQRFREMETPFPGVNQEPRPEKPTNEKLDSESAWENILEIFNSKESDASSADTEK